MATMAKTAILTLLLGLVAPLVAHGQEFPTRPVTIVSSFLAGGPSHVIPRLVADELTKIWGKPVLVENQAGAGGWVAADQVRKANPDGYTLLFASNSLGTQRLLLKAASDFDALNDLAPLSLATTSTLVFMATPETGVSSLREFVALAKANPGKLNVAVAGASQSMDTATLLNKLGISATAVPYTGGAQVTTALLSNEVNAYLGVTAGKIELFEVKKLVPLAVLGETRYHELPNVPTLKESGVDLAYEYFLAFMAPRATPKPLATRIAADIASLVRRADVAEHIRRAGFDPRASTPDELHARLTLQLQLAKDAAAIANIQPQ